jgi:AAA15 family ATPase/GTPase
MLSVLSEAVSAMLTTFLIDRFRGFKKLSMKPLNRFNLILGRNNSGKSSVLEAIFLLAGPTNPRASAHFGQVG